MQLESIILRGISEPLTIYYSEKTLLRYCGSGRRQKQLAEQVLLRYDEIEENRFQLFGSPEILWEKSEKLVPLCPAQSFA